MQRVLKSFVIDNCAAAYQFHTPFARIVVVDDRERFGRHALYVDG